MHENKERLTRIGNAILSASRNELYLSMRFFDLALSGLGYQMNLNTATIATDGVNILYNPTYLQRQYVDDMIQLNRTYLHMVLHCLFRHPFHRGDRDPALWDVACDIAVESILDSMEVKTVAMVIPLFREDVYDRLRQECPVFSAERIYQALERQIIPWEEQLDFYKYFRRDDHKFWGAQQEEEQQGSGQGDGAGDQDQSDERQKELEDKWQDVSEKTKTSMETFFAQHGKEAGTLLQALKVENRERYDYRRFLQRFLTLREEVQVDPDSFDYGELALSTDADEVSFQEHWYRGRWRDFLEVYWNDLNTPGAFRNRRYSGRTGAVKWDCGMLGAHFTLAPGERKTVRFLISWYIPNRRNTWDSNVEEELRRSGLKENRWKNYYTRLCSGAGTRHSVFSPSGRRVVRRCSSSAGLCTRARFRKRRFRGRRRTSPS